MDNVGKMTCFFSWARLLSNLLLPNQRSLVVENLALRHQLLVLSRKKPRPRLTNLDRLFWVTLSRFWSGWKWSLVIVQPRTVIGWHRKRFRLYWTGRSKPRGGRAGVKKEVKDLIRRMAEANPLWAAPRIHGELLKLGIDISERTVSRLMPKRPKDPSPTWRSFLVNHATQLVSIDFFVVPTIRFKILFVFIVLAHHRRKIVHFNVTEHPTARWTAQQMLEAFPEDSAPRFLIRDRHGVYGHCFQGCVKSMGIEEVLTAPRSSWQNGFVERLIGSIRRECLDHVIVMGERHLRRILGSYCDYYHRSRTHLSLAKDSPETRVQQDGADEIIEISQVGGLHHRYERKAA